MFVPRVRRPRAACGRERSFLAPAVLGIALWAGFPTQAAYQDITSLVSGQASATARWAAYIRPSAAGSVHQAEMPFFDSKVQADRLSGSGMETAGIGVVAFQTRPQAKPSSPDEERVNRADKQGRVVSAAPVAPPRLFNAGTVFEVQSSLLNPALDKKERMAFVNPEIAGKEVKVASTFHLRSNGPATPKLPAMIASLVNNNKPDVLAYASMKPDYAETSPFASILKDANAGRFIPPVADTDFDWARQPLPPDVFSDREQQCLAAGVYFEARGESVKGQAAVAQVILNRVRNPAYPSSICGVVYQNESWRNRCQFSFACDGIRDRVRSPAHFRTAEKVAMAVTAGRIWLPDIGTSTHYHATYVRPRWARAMKRMERIGRHVFYRTHGGGWE